MVDSRHISGGSNGQSKDKSKIAIDYARQAQRLAQYTQEQEDEKTGSTQAVEAKFVTPQDAVIETANGGRLPAVPVEEAIKLNKLKDELEDREPSPVPVAGTREAKDGTIHGAYSADLSGAKGSCDPDAPLREASPQYRTNPLFPPLPMYGPPTLLRDLQSYFIRCTSAVLSLCFLLVIVLGAVFTSAIPDLFWTAFNVLTFRDPGRKRPFYEEEKRRKKVRKEQERNWLGKGAKRKHINGQALDGNEEKFVPTEGGPDPLVCDVAYYARRVGLDAEEYTVQTEDGFMLELIHIYNPITYKPKPASQRGADPPEVFPGEGQYSNGHAADGFSGKKQYPVLLIHGLLQSAGAYCCTDDSSLAFYLAKSGYDVWLGNNRCGFRPRHNTLRYSDPRMWAWNIRQMGVMDLPALVSRVLTETGFPRLGLICHSQGTTQTFVALAKEQRPDIGEKISVFCALAPAAYAGPLIGKMYFKFMRVVTPNIFKAMFGIHAFIPFMMEMHKSLPGKFYGEAGYLVFSFLFDWTDERWERDLRNRLFQFSPVYVSSESMRWWLGRECFAKQKCILATRQESKMEDAEDEEDEEYWHTHYSHTEINGETKGSGGRERSPSEPPSTLPLPENAHPEERGRYSWYNEQCPPMALWVAGADDLVDGRRLLRRFEHGREPYVHVVHSKIIEGYEHLDVIWAIDSIEKVGSEIKEVVWRTVSKSDRSRCEVPTGCESLDAWEPPSREKTEDSGLTGQPHGDQKMDGRGSANANEEILADEVANSTGKGKPWIDSTAGEWKEAIHNDNSATMQNGYTSSEKNPRQVSTEDTDKT